MNTEYGDVPFLRNIGMLVTYKCQIACRHCVIEAGPNRKEEIIDNDIYDWVEQISSYRNGYIKAISLTGGEPFYDLEKIEKIIHFANQRNLIVTAVTNAFWASDKKKSVAILKRLKGLAMIGISTDVYHQEFISVDKIKNAVYAANECGIEHDIIICTESREDEKYKNIINILLSITRIDNIKTAITFPAGRALKNISVSSYETTDCPPISSCYAGSSPIIFPDGKIIACIGPVIDIMHKHPLFLGTLKEKKLFEILDQAEVNPILHAIRIWGPKKIISIIENTELSNYLPDKYVKDSICNICYQLMSSKEIVNFFSELSEKLEFRQKVAYARMYYLQEKEMLERFLL